MGSFARRVASVVRGAVAVTAFTAIGLTVTAVVTGGVAAAKGGNAPPGNNGTVKIDGIPIDPGNDNDPHPGCGFTVEFFGYDGGPQSATISLTPWAPTGGGNPYHTSTGWNIGTRTSGNQLDQTVAITRSDLNANGTFTGVTPKAQQGYHVKLEVEVTGSQGSDDKYKVFWLGPCSNTGGSGGPAPQNTSTTSSSTTSSTTEGGTKGTSPTVPTTVAVTGDTTGGGVSLGAGHSAAAGAEAGASAIPFASPSAAAAQHGSNLAFTGFDTLGAIAAGVGLIAAGLLLVQRRRAASS